MAVRVYSLAVFCCDFSFQAPLVKSDDRTSRQVNLFEQNMVVRGSRGKTQELRHVFIGGYKPKVTRKKRLLRFAYFSAAAVVALLLTINLWFTLGDRL